MKTNKLVIYFCCLVGALFFSSCLDNGDNTSSVNLDIAYITYKDNTKLAATMYYGFVSSPVVQSMTEGECYSVSYKVNNTPENGIYKALSFVDLSESPLPQTRLISNAVPQDGMVPLVALTSPVFSSYEDYWGDRWVFGYTVTVGEKETPTMYFYYDKDNQIDKDGKDVTDENKIIIDIYVTKQSLSDSGTSKNKSITTVGNLSSLRFAYSGFVPDYSKGSTSTDGKRYVDVPVQFRFVKQESESSTSEVAYIGSWTSDSAIIMKFVEK